MARVPMVRMAAAVTRSLLVGSACRMYPKRAPAFSVGTRGSLEFDASRCVLCALCARRCPGAALEVDREGGTWKIDRLKCIACGLCVENCPKKALGLLSVYTPPVRGTVRETRRVEGLRPPKS